MASRANEVVYPLFEECANILDDEYWRALFVQCSRGRFPPGIRYDSEMNILSLKADKSREIHKLSKDAEEVLPIVMAAFRSMGMSSATEQIKNMKKGARLSRRKAKQIQSWKEIKSKLKRNELVQEFAYSICEDHKDARYMAAVINNALRFGQIGADDIVMRDGEIEEIHGMRCELSPFSVKVTRSIASKKMALKNTKTSLEKALRVYIKNNAK